MGDVTRVLAPGGTAPFAGGTSSSVSFTIAVSNVNNVLGTADGLGNFSITGGNGSVFTGSLTGTFFRIGSGPTAGLQFNGSVSGVNLTGATFAGNPASGGSFSTDFSSVGGFGALTGFGIILTIPNNNGQFLTTSFGPVSTQSSGQLIPSPGTLALLGLGGLVAARRRRA
ncbi:hypothetical protein J4558_27820 [Leptolyngbya sp. 15MV]|nr:hypothetical protein J4558_27820 [Leptolyngbya sp. 15MV]